MRKRSLLLLHSSSSTIHSHSHCDSDSKNGYHIRVADYRIIYDIFDDVLVVDVIDLGHRKDIYE
ncbi:MAG: type II toxin-antitoxin system RelE/ParE family toxin [Flavobacteriales bacterium]